MYLITYIDVDCHRKKRILMSESELMDYESYCLEFDLPYHVYKLTKLY